MPDGSVPRIEAHYDSRKEWRADPEGYFLIKVFYDKKEIGLRHMSYKHVPLMDICGHDAYAVLQTAVREGLLSSLAHAAYLGYELHKAELALKEGVAYVQDDPLDLSEKAQEPESRNVRERKH